MAVLTKYELIKQIEQLNEELSKYKDSDIDTLKSTIIDLENVLDKKGSELVSKDNIINNLSNELDDQNTTLHFIKQDHLNTVNTLNHINEKLKRDLRDATMKCDAFKEALEIVSK